MIMVVYVQNTLRSMPRVRARGIYLIGSGVGETVVLVNGANLSL